MNSWIPSIKLHNLPEETEMPLLKTGAAFLFFVQYVYSILPAPLSITVLIQ
jgi:hypothetical protein